MRCKKQINIDIGARIKTERERACLTQEQFAERLEVSPQYISDLERGVVGIAIPTLKKVCCVLQVSSDLILFGQASDNISAIIEEKCKELSSEQYSYLLNMIDSYIMAILSERKARR